jgi:spoIIIJ-associated protein
LPEFELANCDQERLFAEVKDVVNRLVYPIVGDVPCTVAIAGSRVRAALDCGDAAGLLVGRDGQTLAAVQYLASRIIARRIGGAVRLQVDAGKYRERQDDKLKEQAFSLAQRVKETGRPLSTRPLTAYQRRIVHLALEQDEAVQTHSKGEGAQRKVTISLKRGSGKNESEAGENKPAPQPAGKSRPAKSAAGRGRQRAHESSADTAAHPSSGVDDADAL